ncbi:MAG TPA: hypothetical protein VFF06_08075 [Polyangia bacterium]|nr:hypothetical protein [Polyangia bacterium]
MPIGQACANDNECDKGSICEQNVCTALPTRRSIFPFYFHQPGDVGYRHIPPLLYFSTWDRGNENQVQFPFFVHLKRAEDKSDTYVIPPLLFQWKTSPTEKTFRLYPIFWHSSFTGEGAGVQSALLPIYWYKGAQHQRHLFIPLFGSGWARDDAKDSTLIAVGFLGWYYRHKDLSTWRLVVPLYFDHSTPGARTIVAPLAYFHTEERSAFGMVFPLLWHARDDDKDVNRWLLLPIFDYEQDHHGRRQRVFSLVGGWEKNLDAGLEQLVLFAPPFIHRRDPLRDFDVLPPLFARWRIHEDESSGWIAGNIYHSSDPEGSTTSVFPVYWGFHDSRSGASTHLILPIGGWHHGPGLNAVVFGPLYGWRNHNGEGSYGLGIAPLVLVHRSGSAHQEMVLPIFARFGDDKTRTTTTAVGPVFARTSPSGFDFGLIPILFAGKHTDRNYTYVPPLFFHYASPQKSVDVVGPGYYYRGARGWAAGFAPLAMFGKLDGVAHQLVLPPLFVRFTDAARDRERMLIGPFYHRRDGKKSLDVLFPLLYVRRTPERSTLISPIAYWKKSPGRELLWIGPWLDRRDDVAHTRTRMLFPIGLVHDAPNYHVIVQFPLFWRVQDGAETDMAVFPFYWRVRGPERSLDAVFPLFLHTRSAVASTTVVGPAWYRARADGGRSAGILPLVIYRKTTHERAPAESGELPHRSSTSWLGAPGVFFYKDTNAGVSDLVAGPLFVARKPDGYTAGLVPLAFAWRRGTDSRVLGPLFYHQRDPAADRALDVAGPIYWGHDGAVKRLGLAPLFFVRKDDERTTVVMPLLGYFQKRKLGSSLITWLFGYNKYPTGSRAYVGPLYWRRDELVSSTALFPLFYFTRDKKTGAVVRLAAPFYFDGRGEDGREVQAYTPAVWRYHSIERTITVGLPLYLDDHVFGESRTTAVLPFVVRHDSKVSNSTQWIFPPILTWARDRRGDDPGKDVVIFPLVWRFGGRDSTTVVAPLWWDFRRGQDRTTVLFPIGARWTRFDSVTHLQESTHTLVLNCYYRRWYGSERDKEKTGAWYVSVYPLFDFGHPRKNDLEWNVIEGLVGYRREGINRTLRIFWLIDLKLQEVKAPVSFFGATPPEARSEL